jgi:hypothetical protein
MKKGGQVNLINISEKLASGQTTYGVASDLMEIVCPAKDEKESGIQANKLQDDIYITHVETLWGSRILRNSFCNFWGSPENDNDFLKKVQAIFKFNVFSLLIM